MVVYEINPFNNVSLNYNMQLKSPLHFEIWFDQLWKTNGNKPDKSPQCIQCSCLIQRVVPPLS